MSDGGAQAIFEIGKLFAPLLKRAFGVFIRTTLGLAMLGTAMLFLSWYWAAQTAPLNGWLALGATLVLFAVGGCMLAVKRAVASAVCQAVDELDLGPKGLNLVFSRMLEVRGTAAQGDRGTDHARMAENLPLEEAEDRLKSAVTRVLKAPIEGGGPGGYLRRKVLGTLVRKIELVTLVEFRTAEQAASGVNLVLVRDRLGQEIDVRLLGLVRSASRKTTALFVMGLLAASCLSSWGIAQIQF
jgi:hypothetical protein